jgi:hypothetical protein
MSAKRGTVMDMEEMHRQAVERGLGVKFWDDQRRFLIITLPPPPAATPPPDGEVNGSAREH